MQTYPLNNILYQAEDAELFHCTRNSGIFAQNSFPYTVTGIDNNITIGKGIAWIKNGEFSGKVVANKENVSLDLGLPDSTFSRVDVVAIRFNKASNETTIVVKQGTASANPSIPAITQTESVYELYLYSILRNAGATSISQMYISDLRLNSQYCGIMADSVTSVDTDAMNAQFTAFITSLVSELESVKTGSGVMLSSTYDSNSDGTVDDSEMLGGELPSYYAEASRLATTSDTANSMMTDVSHPFFGAKYNTINGLSGYFAGYIYSNGTKLNLSIPLWKVIPSEEKRTFFTVSGTIQIYGSTGTILYNGTLADLGEKSLSNSWNMLNINVTLATPLSNANRTSVTCYCTFDISITLKDSAVWKG